MIMVNLVISRGFVLVDMDSGIKYRMVSRVGTNSDSYQNQDNVHDKLCKATLSISASLVYLYSGSQCTSSSEPWWWSDGCYGGYSSKRDKSSWKICISVIALADM